MLSFFVRARIHAHNGERRRVSPGCTPVTRARCELGEVGFRARCSYGIIIEHAHRPREDMMDWFSSTLTNALIATILILLTIRTIIDLLLALNLAPRMLKTWSTESRREEFRDFIGMVGIDEQIRRARSIAQVLRVSREFHEDNSQLQKRLEKIVSKYIDQGKYSIGSVSKQRVRYFLNLRHAFCAMNPAEEIDRVLAEIMLAYVTNECQREGISFDLVVSRRSGLDVLGYLVAKAMETPFLLYSTGDGVWQASTSDTDLKRRPIDYQPHPARNAIIIDDSCVGGGDFRDMARDLKDYGVTVTHVFVLFCRKEVDAAEKLRREDMRLHALDIYGDDRLESLRGQ